MGAASAVARGLSGEELQSIRDAVDAGRKPKVMFTEAAGQIAGQVGQVLDLTDPAHSDEWIVVRFGRDELPFSPTDLTIPPRKPPRRPDPKPTPEPAPRPAAAPEPAAASRPAAPEPATAPAPAAETTSDSPSRRKETSMTTVDATKAGPGAKPARRNGKAAKSKGTAGLTVTLTYQDGQWSVGAAQGNKSVARPQMIKPAEALKMVALIEVPEVQEAVEQILAAERAEAEEQAQKLRAELAEVEARLAELRDTD